MSASSDLQAAIIELLAQPGALRVNVPVLARFPEDLSNDVDAAAAVMTGLCIYVEPVIPSKADSMQGGDVVFFDAADVTVVIIEIPALNNAGATAYDLIDDVIAYLHWQPKAEGTKLGQIVAHPLQLAPHPVDVDEGVAKDRMVAGKRTRVVAVHFNATYGFAPAS